jgi:hypothetical protein
MRIVAPKTEELERPTQRMISSWLMYPMKPDETRGPAKPCPGRLWWRMT